jgi:hypothetical protein
LTYVIRAAVTDWNKRAMRLQVPDRALPRRPQNAEKPIKKDTTAKKRDIR